MVPGQHGLLRHGRDGRTRGPWRPPPLPGVTSAAGSPAGGNAPGAHPCHSYVHTSHVHARQNRQGFVRCAAAETRPASRRWAQARADPSVPSRGSRPGRSRAVPGFAVPPRPACLDTRSRARCPRPALAGLWCRAAHAFPEPVTVCSAGRVGGVGSSLRLGLGSPPLPASQPPSPGTLSRDPVFQFHRIKSVGILRIRMCQNAVFETL